MKKKILITLGIILVVIGLGVGIYKLMNSRAYQVIGNITNKINTDKKVVALTFDDGPTKNTDKILDILNEEDIKATFYLIGSDIEKNLEEGKNIVKEGHQVGNHTYTHTRNVFKSPSFIKNELTKTNELINSIGYEGEINFRPPFGKKLFVLPYYLNKYNIDTIMWNLEPDTYFDKAKDKEKYVLENIEPGSIILMHPMYNEESIDALKGIITGLKEKGYEFLTVDELLKLEK